MLSRVRFEDRLVQLGLATVILGTIAGLPSPENRLILLVATILAVGILVYGDSLSRTIALLAWSIVVSTMGLKLLPFTAAAAYIASISYVPLRVDPEKPPETRKLLLIPLFYTPIILVYPVSMIPLASYLLALTYDWARASMNLAKVKVSIPTKEISIIYGEEASVPVLIKSDGIELYYSIFLDDRLAAKNRIKGEEVVHVKLRPRAISLERHRIELVLMDKKARTQRVTGPYTVYLRVLLASLKAILRIRRILLKYREIIGTPLIYRGITPRITLGEEGEAEQGLGAEGVGEGEEGEGKGERGEGYEGVKPHSIALPAESGLEELRIEDISYKWIPYNPPQWGRSRGPGEGIVGYIGDYRGVREYSSGDKPTYIHWKKSISRRQLIVKTYESGGEGGGGGEKLLIVADWVSRSPEELDELIKKTYSAVLHGIGEKYIFLRLPNGVEYFIRGGVPEVLAALDEILRTEGITQLLNYGGWRRRDPFTLLREILNTRNRISVIGRYYILHARALVSSLKKMGVEEGIGFTMIYSDATSLRNQALYEVLNDTYISKSVTEEEVLELLPEILRRAKLVYKA